MRPALLGTRADAPLGMTDRTITTMPGTISLIDAPSNLGLAPPAPGKEPGVCRMAQTLRQLGVQERLGALNGGEVILSGKEFEHVLKHSRPDVQRLLKLIRHTGCRPQELVWIVARHCDLRNGWRGAGFE